MGVTQERVAGLPRWLSGKESAGQAGDTSLIPRLGRSPGGGNKWTGNRKDEYLGG